jgi:hypothetical protein
MPPISSGAVEPLYDEQEGLKEKKINIFFGFEFSAFMP